MSGNSNEDRYFDLQLNNFLDSQDVDEDGMTLDQRRKAGRDEYLIDNASSDGDEYYRDEDSCNRWMDYI